MITKKEIVHDIINKWAVDNDLDNPKWIKVLMYEIYGRNIYIYTTHPGLIIGKYGSCINDLKKRLKENHIRKKVNIIELKAPYTIEELKIKRRLL